MDLDLDWTENFLKCWIGLRNELGICWTGLSQNILTGFWTVPNYFTKPTTSYFEYMQFEPDLSTHARDKCGVKTQNCHGPPDTL